MDSVAESLQDFVSRTGLGYAEWHAEGQRIARQMQPPRRMADGSGHHVTIASGRCFGIVSDPAIVDTDRLLMLQRHTVRRTTDSDES